MLSVGNPFTSRLAINNVASRHFGNDAEPPKTRFEQMEALQKKIGQIERLQSGEKWSTNSSRWLGAFNRVQELKQQLKALSEAVLNSATAKPKALSQKPTLKHIRKHKKKMVIRTAQLQANQQKKAKIANKINWLEQETNRITTTLQRAQTMDIFSGVAQGLIEQEKIKRAHYQEALNTLKTLPVEIKRLNKKLILEKKKKNNQQELMRLKKELKSLWYRLDQALKC